jgi:hypothetical protein
MASKLGTFGRRQTASGRVTLIVRVGPFILDEAADHWLAASFLAPVVGMIGVRLSHLVEGQTVSEAQWQTATVVSHRGLTRMGKLIGQKLAGFGLDAEGLLQEFDRARDILARGRR